MKGLYNLARGGSKIELRIVIHKMNYQRLYKLSEYIWKNLPFVAYVSFMGMETTGYCLLPPTLFPFARKSISDWKVHYLDDCLECSKKAECSGLFSTSRKQSEHIRPIGD